MTLYDPNLVSLRDLGCQFFLSSVDIGKRRDVVTCPKLAELNSYVPVNVLETLSEELISGFQVFLFKNLILGDCGNGNWAGTTNLFKFYN